MAGVAADTQAVIAGVADCDVDRALDRARAGDERGFDVLFRATGASVVGYLRSRNVSDPDGVANEVFLRAFRSIHTFTGDGARFRSWLFTIAHNAAIDDARRRRRRINETSLDTSADPAGGDVEDDVDASLAHDRVEALLDRLSPDQRDVIALRIIADLSVDQTAAVLDKSYEAVKALQRRGLASLRRALLRPTGCTEMNDAAVPPNKMDGPDDFDDASTEALLTGAGHDVDLHLAALLGDLRVVYTSRAPSVGADLGAFIGLTAGLATASSSPRWAHTRSVIAKIGAAVAALVATTSGLAVAGALPAPVQDALSHIGIGGGSSGSSHDHHTDIPADAADTTTTNVEGATTTVPQNATPTSDADHHGAVVSGVAHDHTTHGCEHGHAVANVASDAKSNAQPCPNTSTTTPTGTTPTTTSRYDPTSDNPNNNDHTSPTTAAASPPGRDHGGDSNPAAVTAAIAATTRATATDPRPQPRSRTSRAPRVRSACTASMFCALCPSARLTHRLQRATFVAPKSVTCRERSTGSTMSHRTVG